jgi:hypothetical protein
MGRHTIDGFFREQAEPGEATIISYEDKAGHWHKEKSAGDDRPEAEVEG